MPETRCECPRATSSPDCHFCSFWRSRGAQLQQQRLQLCREVCTICCAGLRLQHRVGSMDENGSSSCCQLVVFASKQPGNLQWQPQTAQQSRLGLLTCVSAQLIADGQPPISWKKGFLCGIMTIHLNAICMASIWHRWLCQGS